MNRPTRPVPPGILALRWNTKQDKTFGWDGYRSIKDGEVHIIPVNDDLQHTCYKTCWCEPRELDDLQWMHNSFDRREDYENGLRKTN